MPLGFHGFRALAAGALAATFMIAPVAAQDEPAPLPDFAAMTGPQAFQTMRDNPGRWLREPCDFGMPLLEVMQRAEPENIPVVRGNLYVEALCADQNKRYQDGANLIRKLNAMDADSPEVGLTLYFARQTDDADWALETLSVLRGEQLGSLTTSSFWSSARAIRQAGRQADLEALALKWFDDSQIAFIDTDLHSGLARNALIAAARDSRSDIALQLLGYISDPSTYVEMLTAREFEPFWPQIEERAGPGLEKVGAENVETTRLRLSYAPADRDRFSAAARALHFNGDFQTAVELADRWRQREERGLELEEGDAWALNIQAYAYDSLGQPEKADAVFEELAALDPEDNNWLVNFVINRASRLVGHGRWAEGLAAAQLARTVPGSTYAEMIVAKDHACALYQMGRADDAQAEIVFLRENRNESVHLAAQGLLCLGLRDEAAQMLIAGLADPATRPSAIAALERAEADLFYTQSTLPPPRALMEEYPELAAAFAQHARDLPEAFIPRASRLRARLDLPEWEPR
jgi:tetratricopeptide (TPR) repeat protein